MQIPSPSMEEGHCLSPLPRWERVRVRVNRNKKGGSLHNPTNHIIPIIKYPPHPSSKSVTLAFDNMKWMYHNLTHKANVAHGCKAA